MFIRGRCTLSFLHLQSFSYAEASCFFVYCHFVGVRVPDVHLPQRSPLKLAVTRCHCHDGTFESDTRAFLSPQPGTLKQGIKDVEALVDEEVDGSLHSVWLTVE